MDFTFVTTGEKTSNNNSAVVLGFNGNVINLSYMTNDMALSIYNESLNHKDTQIENNDIIEIDSDSDGDFDINFETCYSIGSRSSSSSDIESDSDSDGGSCSSSSNSSIGNINNNVDGYTGSKCDGE